MPKIWAVYTYGGKKRGRPEAYFSSIDMAEAYAKKKIQALQTIYGETANQATDWPGIEEIILDDAQIFPYFVVQVGARGKVCSKQCFFRSTYPDLDQIRLENHTYRREKTIFQGVGRTFHEARRDARILWAEYIEKLEVRRRTPPQMRFEDDVVPERVNAVGGAEGRLINPLREVAVPFELPPMDDWDPPDFVEGNDD